MLLNCLCFLFSGAHYMNTNTRSCPPGFSKYTRSLKRRAQELSNDIWHLCIDQHRHVVYRWKALELYFSIFVKIWNSFPPGRPCFFFSLDESLEMSVLVGTPHIVILNEIILTNTFGYTISSVSNVYPSIAVACESRISLSLHLEKKHRAGFYW